MTYTILDSMKEEITLLEELLADSKKNESDAVITHHIYSMQLYSLRRIYRRFELGREYSLSTNAKGKTVVRYDETNKHLERKYPELAASAAAHDDLVEQAKLMEKLSDNT